MPRLSNLTRIALSLTLISVGGLLGLRSLGIFDDGHAELLTARVRLCEQAAVCCSEFISRADAKGIGVVLEALSVRNPELLSVAWRNANGEVAWKRGSHEELWKTTGKAAITNCLFVPIMQGNTEQGRVEMVFKPLAAPGLAGFMAMPSIQAIGMAALLNFVGFFYCLRKCLQTLDPNRVVPQRVRSALDTLAEGVLVLDARKRIVLANEAMALALETDRQKLAGRSLSSLPWNSDTDWEEILQVHSADVALTNRHRNRVRLATRHSSPGKDPSVRTFLVSATEIFDDAQVSRGLLVSFDDITAMEKSTQELEAALSSLQSSQKEIQAKNEELHFLATRDSLTGCLNRRSLFEQLERQWKLMGKSQRFVACIMTDIDHFKSINDKYGHAMGDEVLRKVSKALLSSVDDGTLVCRYGGEEFCIVMPEADGDHGRDVAERLRTMIEAIEFPNLCVTASFGVAASDQGAANPEELIEQADKGLYEAKRGGRNRVHSFTPAPVVVSLAEQADQVLRQVTALQGIMAIPAKQDASVVVARK
jgi:diguanylate cyclase (GGDEF)-like protein/PAS domain S-box-containing protein